MSSKRPAWQANEGTVVVGVCMPSDRQLRAYSDARLNYQGQAFSDADLQASTAGKLAWGRSLASLSRHKPVSERRTCPSRKWCTLTRR